MFGIGEITYLHVHVGVIKKGFMNLTTSTTCMQELISRD